MQYVKKPQPIQAVQIVVGANIPAWLDPYRMGGEIGTVQHEIELEFHQDVYNLKTNHGWVTANVGDWILQSLAGEIYPCKADVFAATYEPAGPDPRALHLPLVIVVAHAESIPALKAFFPTIPVYPIGAILTGRRFDRLVFVLSGEPISQDPIASQMADNWLARLTKLDGVDRKDQWIIL